MHDRNQLLEEGIGAQQQTNPTIQFERITAPTVWEIDKLSETLPPQQRATVADNAVSIAEAHVSEQAWFRAIYVDGIDCPGVFLRRLMIAGPHQGKGYGRGPSCALSRRGGPSAVYKGDKNGRIAGHSFTQEYP